MLVNHNRFAELISRIIIETIHKMLFSVVMTRKFLVDELSIACYLMDRSPSIAIEYWTLEEKWSYCVVNYSVFIIFG